MNGAAAGALLLAGAIVAPPASAHLVGGAIENRAVADPAVEIARRDAPVNVAGRRWIAWKVPSSGDRTVGCFSGWTRDRATDCGCTLGAESKGWGSSDSFPNPGGDIEIFAAVAGGRVEELTLASESCAVRALGERVTILDGVDVAAGVELLTSLALDSSREELSKKALAVIAQHSAKAVPSAPAAIVHVAREARDPDQRGHALFWLSQTDEPRAARWIREAIGRDPEEDVRHQAVFALSQLPDGTDQLLAIIRESRDREVRKQALFWLGQSNDPRAFAEIERVLAR